MNGYPGATEQMVDVIASDAFLKGCREKRAALTAMDKQPATLDKALQLVRNAESNQRVLMGDTKSSMKEELNFQGLC